jgi:epoxide hydrolase-like predicted phosphatase
MMVIKAVIFDMGGVLLRTTDMTPREKLAERAGITRHDLEMLVFASQTAIQAETGTIREADHWNSVFENLKIPPEEREKFKQKFWSKDQVDYDLLEFINGLRENYRTGLLSNAWDGIRPVIKARFPRMLEVFDVVVFSAEVGIRKPDPRYYQWMLDQLGVTAPEAIFVDDWQPNIEGARMLGIKAIRFTNSQQCRGDIIALLNHHQGG